MQGLGLYTLEELKFSPSGLLYTRGPSQYKIPAVCDMPLQFNVYLLPDTHNPHAIYSSKVRGHDTEIFAVNYHLPSWQCFHWSALKLSHGLCASAGYWRTCPLPGEFSVFCNQRRCGCCSFWVRSSRPIFPGQPRHTGENLPGLCLPFHSEGNEMLVFWLIKLTV